MKQQIFAIGTILIGIAGCAAVLFLQGGGLVASPNSSPATQILSVPVRSAPIPVAAPEPSVSPEELEEVVVIDSRLRSRPATPKAPVQRGVGRRDRCKKQALETGGDVVVCDSKKRTAIDRRTSGSLIGDYRKDFLEALE